MIKTTNAYKEAIKNNRILHHRAEIRFTDGTTITAEDAGLFTFRIDENTSNANSFDIGAAVAKQLTLKLDNLDDKYSAHDFSGAEITAYVGLDVSDKTEWLNKGTYYAEPGEDSGDTITVSAYDKMTEFDQPYTISNLIYPATLGQIVRDACSCCNVSLCADSASFDNDSFIVETRPEDSNTTFRQVLRWVGEIACKFSRINSNNQLTLQWYDIALLESSSIDSDSRVVHIDNLGSGSTFSTDDVVITGIRVIEETKETANVEIIYQYGADGYVLEISGNKLIQGGKGQEVAQLVGSKLNGLQFRPLSVNCQSDPSIEVGDIGLVTDRKGRTYKTIITGAPYTARALQTLSCGAEAPARLSATRYSEATKVYKELRKNLLRQKTEWQKAMENLEKAMKEQAGLYPVVKTLDDGSKVYYMCDHQTLEESSVVFELNAKGWAVSTDGGKTWNAGLMVDGALITKILNSIGINADWINSGAITIMDAKGNTTFKADTVTGRVDIIADSFQLRGKTVEEIAKETAGKYVDDTIGDIIKDVTSQYFGKYDPTLSNIPASEWTDIETKDKHLNDIFYNTDTKKTFRFIKTANTYTWENFTDPDIQTALDNASKAQDTADGKRRVFMATPIPPYDAGDMWATSTADGKADIKICKAAKAAGSVFSSADWIDPAYVDENDVQETIEEYDNSLGQPEIFNKLTNNGKNKGIYIENGELYINASYILSGILAGKLINAKGIEVTDKDNEITLKIDDDGHVFIKATEFTLQGKNIEEVISEKSDKFRTLNVSLSNEFQAIPTDMDGKYTSFPSCSTTVTVLYGNEDVTNTSIISFETSGGISGSASKNVYTVTGLSTDTGTVTVTVERGSLTVEKQFTVVKQKQGVQGSQGLQGETGETGATGNGISSITTYYLASASSSYVYVSTSGWTTSVQSPTSSKPYLWSYQTTYYTNGTSSSTTPHIIGVRGENGKDAGELTQQQIFNILTNNGQTQGIYLSNGKIYINGEYIKSDSISADALNVTDLSAFGATIGGFSITDSGLSVVTSGGYTFLISSANKRLSIADGTSIQITHRNVNRERIVLGGPTTAALLGNVDCAGITSDRLNTGSVTASAASKFSGGLIANTLNVSGSKSRIFNTQSYGVQQQYCYEMPTPFFGDIGSSVISDDGTCIVDVDDIFQESVNANINYYVFLQKEGEGDCYIEEKYATHFTVKGTPGLKFSFELKARQLEFEHMRFRDDAYVRYETESDYKDLDYESILLKEMEQTIERMSEI